MKLDSIRSAGHWLSSSGIQNVSRQKKLRGGVSAWYELGKKIYPFIYSEITGYAISTWVFLNRITPDPLWIKNAKAAADWLIDNAMHPNGGVKTRLYLVKHYVSPNYSFHTGRIYSFDTAMAGYGLIQLFQATGEDRFFKAADSMLRFLIQRMQKKDGTFYPYFDSALRRPGEDLEKWSDQCGSFHAKLALFFTDYFDVTGDRAVAALITKLLDATLKSQEKEGRFLTGRKDGSTHLHPHSYTLEGLVYSGIYFKREDYLRAALRGFLWMMKGVSSDGSVSSIYEKFKFSHHERSDIVAQTLRLGSMLYSIFPTRLRPLLPALASIKKHLLLFQNGDAGRQRGGFLYGAATDGLMRDHLNAWATMFALQALWMHEAFVEKKKPVCLESFV